MSFYWKGVAPLVVALASLAAISSTPVASRAGDATPATDPADRAVLSHLPSAAVVMTDRPVDTTESHLSLRSPRGELRSPPVDQPAPGAVRIRIAPFAGETSAADEPGIYTLAWHIVADDGTELIGSIQFSVGTGVAPPPRDGKTVTADAKAVLGHMHTVDPLSAVMLVADLIVVCGVLFLLVRRPSGRTGRRRWSVRFDDP